MRGRWNDQIEPYDRISQQRYSVECRVAITLQIDQEMYLDLMGQNDKVQLYLAQVIDGMLKGESFNNEQHYSQKMIINIMKLVKVQIQNNYIVRKRLILNDSPNHSIVLRISGDNM
ncbi:Hypothetical_protein [Hexamita inflata]|uniref:Hypothetical_protein n=1 Tax=Hexamita inflata TaxID=28002 RepID=A0ABP1H4E3_9EUKA